MAIIYLAKNGEEPIGAFSSIDKAILVSDNIDEVDVQFSNVNSKLYYAEAVYSMLTMNNGKPESKDIILEPGISDSADKAISQLYKKTQQRRMNGCTLNSFYCFEIDKDYTSNNLEQMESSVYKPWEYVNCGRVSNCKNDPLIQAKWMSLQKGEPIDLDNLSLKDIITVFVTNGFVDLHSSFNQFSLNFLIDKFVDMASKNESIYILLQKTVPCSLAKVQYDTVGYMCFFDKDIYDRMHSNFKNDYITKELEINRLLKMFVESPEYGIYFVTNVDKEEFAFLDKDIIEMVWRKVGVLSSDR